jgi:hypothetical protein
MDQTNDSDQEMTVTSYVMTRSFADCMGFKWPKDLACIVNGERITYAQLKAKRIAEQKERLRRMETEPRPERRAAFVWVFYQPGLFGFCFEGYWLAIRTLKHTWTFGFRGSEDRSGLKTIDIMRMLPCGFLPLQENAEKWKEKFVKTYSRPGRFRKQGMVAGWVETDHDGGWPQRFTIAEPKMR